MANERDKQQQPGQPRRTPPEDRADGELTVDAPSPAPKEPDGPYYGDADDWPPAKKRVPLKPGLEDVTAWGGTGWSTKGPDADDCPDCDD